MTLIKYPKFVQTGQHTNVPACPTTTAITFSTPFVPATTAESDMLVVMANLSSTCGWAGATNVTTAGFDLWAENAGTAEWLAVYQSI